MTAILWESSPGSCGTSPAPGKNPREVPPASMGHLLCWTSGCPIYPGSSERQQRIFMSELMGEPYRYPLSLPVGALLHQGKFTPSSCLWRATDGRRGYHMGPAGPGFSWGNRPHQVTFCRSRPSRSGRGELSPVADSATSLLYEVSWVRAALLADVSLMLLAVALKTGSVVFQRCLSPAVLTTPTSATGSSNLIVNHCRAKGRSC